MTGLPSPYLMFPPSERGMMFEIMPDDGVGIVSGRFAAYLKDNPVRVDGGFIMFVSDELLEKEVVEEVPEEDTEGERE